MYGFDRFPTFFPPDFPPPAPPSLKRLWPRYPPDSTKRAPFLLLLLFLSCQLLLLAILRSPYSNALSSYSFSSSSGSSFFAHLLWGPKSAPRDGPLRGEISAVAAATASSSSSAAEYTEEGSLAGTESAKMDEDLHRNISGHVQRTSARDCENGYVFVYDLPPMFNTGIASKCVSMNPWQSLCSSFLNKGMGVSLGHASPLRQVGSWYFTDQFMLEVLFHHRILQSPCITRHPHEASAFYIPYYAGLDIGQYLWSGFSAQQRDGLSDQLMEWLSQQDSWIRHGGSDHFMMIGRITWDFRRSKDEDWGSGFFYKPSMKNVTRLVIERNPWDEKEMAVPYPTDFHPQSDAVLVAWQDHIRNLERKYLFSFAGAPRQSFPNDFRGILVDQCRQAHRGCLSLDCSNKSCLNNQKTLELFMSSAFCLQPRGDSFTRKSTFDCLLAGSIPVFFWHRSAYWQYKWHLPDDESSYSVFIPKQDIRNGSNVEEILKAIAPEKVRAMREKVIGLIPKIVYARSGASLEEHSDAFDVAMEGVMKKLRGIPMDRE